MANQNFYFDTSAPCFSSIPQLCTSQSSGLSVMANVANCLSNNSQFKSPLTKRSLQHIVHWPHSIPVHTFNGRWSIDLFIVSMPFQQTGRHRKCRKNPTIFPLYEIKLILTVRRLFHGTISLPLWFGWSVLLLPSNPTSPLDK